MKLVILACLASVAVAAPQFDDLVAPAPQVEELILPSPRLEEIIPVVKILRDDRQDDGNGNFNYAFEADNGIVVEAAGTPGSLGQVNMQGIFRFLLPDGRTAEVRYIADENGFQPQSDFIPTPHPLPAHAIEQIRFAEEQRAAGATWDLQGRRLTR
ncbi:cuticle protein AM1199-like [Panulirus ornatus]|uniref:cuticle protein AM1199-like n=1 Tax=Panulirus ornatus TaxID=150431 RepID=UPI003A89B6B9